MLYDNLLKDIIFKQIYYSLIVYNSWYSSNCITLAPILEPMVVARSCSCSCGYICMPVHPRLKPRHRLALAFA